MKKWRSDQSGATIIEFALVAPVFFLLMLGIIEFSLIGFSQVVIESAVSATAREASLGKATGGDRVQYVRDHIKQKLDGLINVDSLVISANTVAAGGASQKADICLSNPPRYGGPCDPPLVYQDENGNGVYDAVPLAVSLGNAGDLIEVRVLYPWKVQLPLLNRFFGDNGIFTITSSAVVKNEPF